MLFDTKHVYCKEQPRRNQKQLWWLPSCHAAVCPAGIPNIISWCRIAATYVTYTSCSFPQESWGTTPSIHTYLPLQNPPENSEVSFKNPCRFYKAFSFWNLHIQGTSCLQKYPLIPCFTSRTHWNPSYSLFQMTRKPVLVFVALLPQLSQSTIPKRHMWHSEEPFLAGTPEASAVNTPPNCAPTAVRIPAVSRNSNHRMGHWTSYLRLLTAPICTRIVAWTSSTVQLSWVIAFITVKS